jgi:hypothetical protein
MTQTAVFPGDILMDSTSLEDAFAVIYGVPSFLPDAFLLPSLAQLVQSLVIHRRILVEPGSYEKHILEGLSTYINESGLAGLIEPIPLDDLELVRLAALASKRSREISASVARELSDGLLHQAYAQFEAQRTVRYLIDVFQPDEEPRQEVFVRGIAWRAYLYFAISCHKGVPYLPNRFRAPVIEHDLRSGFFYKKAADAALKAVEEAAVTVLDERNQLLGQRLFELKFPPILNYVLSQAKGSRTEIIPRTLELRETSAARAFRKLCTAVDQATKEGNLLLLGETLDEIRSRSKTWLREVDAPSIDVAIAYPLGIEFDPLGLWEYVKLRRKHHLIFLERLFEASVQVNGTAEFSRSRF